MFPFPRLFVGLMLFCFVLFEFPYVLASLELAMPSRLVSNSHFVSLSLPFLLKLRVCLCVTMASLLYTFFQSSLRALKTSRFESYS